MLAMKPKSADHHALCATCGTQFGVPLVAAMRCPICEDDRQSVGRDGQRWTTHAELATRHQLRIEDDDGLLGIGIGIGVDGGFAIGQRALWLGTDAGCILWDCVSLVTDEALDALRRRGGVDLMVISHPHFYASMAQWSEALGGVPILLHRADREWIQCDSPAIRHWQGERLQLSAQVTLIRTGGHFPGSTALHWAGGARAGGALLCGDSPQVVADRHHVSFMHSFPNQVPMRPRLVREMRARLAGLAFENAYGYTWGRNIIGGARDAVDASFNRYLRAIAEDSNSQSQEIDP
jgi:hypothetical protein